MWEKIKNDPVFKTASIFILGVLAFGIAFNIMFGSNMAGAEHGMSGGYSLDNTLAYILGIVIKLFLIGLFILLIILGYKSIKSHLIEGNSNLIKEKLQSNRKLAIVVLGPFVAIVLLLSVAGLYPHTNSYKLVSHNPYLQPIGYGSASGLNLLALLANFLLGVSILALVLSFVLYLTHRGILRKSFSPSIKQAIVVCRNCGQKSNNGFLYCVNCGLKLKDSCEDCGTELKLDWQCCPKCGKETINQQENISV